MPGYVSYGTPMLVSRFNVIYAVNVVYSGSNMALRYRQVEGGSASGWVSEHGVAYHSNSPDAAVSPSGWLYVVYWYGAGPDIMYADNYYNSGDMTNRFSILSGATNYSNPVIDVYGSPETVTMAYYANIFTTEYNDALFVGYCPAYACTNVSAITFEYPLDSSKHWDVNSYLDIVSDAGTNAFFVFQARNDDTAGDYEIFEGFTTSGSPQGVYNISNLPGYDLDPTIGLTASYIPVTTWLHGSNEIYEFETYPAFFYIYQRKIHTASHNITGLHISNRYVLQRRLGSRDLG